MRALSQLILSCLRVCWSSEQREQESRHLARRAFTKSLPQYPFRRMDPAAYASFSMRPTSGRESVLDDTWLQREAHAGLTAAPAELEETIL